MRKSTFDVERKKIGFVKYGTEPQKSRKKGCKNGWIKQGWEFFDVWFE